MSGLELHELSVAFGSTLAVDQVTLSVPERSVLALVGPSGCGKSTVLRCVAGLVEPSAGRIAWGGLDIAGVPTHRRDVGLMFQDHALFTHRSVADNVGFGLKMAGRTPVERARRVDELLHMVGLDGFGERAVDALSGGEAQRVALARALAPEPQLLLLDEPLASLDRARRLDLNAELGRLLRELGQTAIYVTHDQDEAFAVADHLGVMDRGRLLRVGTPEAVWRDPQVEFVARFLGHDTIIERGGHQFAVRPDALTIGPMAEFSGDAVAGRAIASVFQGDRFEVTVDVDGVIWRAFSSEPYRSGSPVQIKIDPDRLARLQG